MTDGADKQNTEVSYQELIKYAATERQREALEMLASGMSKVDVARHFGVHKKRIYEYLKACKFRAARQEKSLHHGGVVPDGFAIKGVSTYIDRDGAQAGQWVKTDADKKRQAELMMQALNNSLADYKGRSKPYKAPKKLNADLLAVYPFGDPHIGMYSWAAETGSDFDCDIAERSMFCAVDYLCDATQAAETAIILSVGDTFHADTRDNRSLNSGHSFDVDTRWSRVMEIGVSIMLRCIDRALQKHKRVIFRAMKGNHDWHGADALNIAVKMFYSNNKRVTVDTSPAYFWYHQFGNVLIGSTHGNSCKPDALPAIMADDVPDMWGTSEHRYWYTGHIHTRQVMEFRGCTWESFRTLAPRDAWHAEKGYKGRQDMFAIAHDRQCGEVYRHRCDIRKLRIS